MARLPYEVEYDQLHLKLLAAERRASIAVILAAVGWSAALFIAALLVARGS